ncbi:PAS domain-containing protein [Pseudanabaena sp. UWO311]|uniref:PAS domain-containing sensor histidine kinase n=1 Tax=Pseudanabaena sp. UWO311 TaxID=2487337 RepID=UPI0011589FD7|nr:PAS domain-containing sensor histidine kinase [Pseudanabaena sp. UWO311]TYQ25084.1 PAS domain-containing protein [Pseudanabaena sp. UWO311]
MDNLDETKLNEAILRLFYDLPFIGMAITSPETKCWVKFNDRLCEILGYSREELPHITWTEITHPDDLELDVVEFERVMRGETEGYVMDKRFIRKDRSVIHASIDVKCVRKEDLTIDFFIATVQDISDRKLAEARQKQAEQALAKSEERYRQVVQTQIDFVLRSQPDTTITFANESLCRALGKTLDQVIGLKWIDLAPADELQSTLQKISTLSPLNPSFLAENQDKRADGQIGYTQWINQGVFDDQGQLIGIQSTGRDVTAIKHAEMALKKLNDELEIRIEQRTADLQQSEARNLAIIKALPDLLLLLKPDGTCIQCILPSTDDKSKYIPIKHHISEVLSPEDLQVQIKIAETAIATGEVQIYEHQLTKFGKTVYEEVRITPYGADELLVIVRDITNHKLAEEQLIKSDAHLKVAQRISKLGSWEFDLRTGDVIWSEEVFRIFGRAPAFGTPTYPELQKSLHSDDWEYFDQVVQNAIATCQSYEVEYRICWADGTLIYVLARGEIICDLMGNAIQIVGTLLDISDRKEIEQQLQNLTDRLTLAIKSASIGIWEWDIAHNCLVWDERTYELYGINPDQSSDAYLAWVSRVHPSDRAIAETAVQLALNGEKEYEPEFRIVLPDGNIRYLKAYALVQRNTDGEPQRLIGINFDITDRKLAEELLLKSDTHLKTAQRIGKLGSWEFEVNTGKLTWSDEVFRIYGLEPSGNPPDYDQLQLYIHPEDWQNFDQTVQAAMSLEQSYDLEHRIIQPNGTLIYVMARGEMIYNVSGQLTHIIGTAIDITDRKLAEAKILHAANQLANTNRELESFSYSVSHDLRAPLRHMNGFVNALQQRLKNHEALQDPKVTHYLQVIEKSSQKMGHLIDGLLTLSRFGRRPLESKQISIRDLVDEAIEIIRTDPSHNPLIEFAIGDLPTTVGDRTLLQQVFHNLIGNAVKFSRNQPQPYIEIDSLPDQTIRIRDNGVGFQMEYADKLFGAFQRLHNDSEFEGTGIGLAIVQRIVQRHGGSIWAEGYPDQGATFFIKL